MYSGTKITGNKLEPGRDTLTYWLHGPAWRLLHALPMLTVVA
jgi:hypothetical protein